MAETNVEAESRILEAARELRTRRQSVIQAMEKSATARAVFIQLSTQHNRAETRSREAERKIKLLKLGSHILSAELTTLKEIAHAEFKVWTQSMDCLWSTALYQSDAHVLAAARDYSQKTTAFATVQQLRETYQDALAAAHGAVPEAEAELQLAKRDEKKAEIAQQEAQATYMEAERGFHAARTELLGFQRQLNALACAGANVPEPWYGLGEFDNQSARHLPPVWKSVTRPYEAMMNIPKPLIWTCGPYDRISRTVRANLGLPTSEDQQ